MRRAAAVIATLVAAATGALAAEIPLDQRRPDSDFISADSRAMQNDDTANPAMLVLLDGETLWNTKAGAANRSCADCHGDAEKSMKGVAARYPAYASELGRPVDLAQQINLSRTMDQKAPAFAFESKELLALTVYIARQSRGMPVAIKEDAKAKSFIAAGRALFEQRQGQLNLSCAQCHDDNWGEDARRQSHSAGDADRLSDLPPGMAGGRLAAAAAAQLHERHARGVLRIRRAGAGRSRILPDVARPRAPDGSAGGAAVNNVAGLPGAAYGPAAIECR